MMSKTKKIKDLKLLEEEDVLCMWEMFVFLGKLIKLEKYKKLLIALELLHKVTLILLLCTLILYCNGFKNGTLLKSII